MKEHFPPVVSDILHMEIFHVSTSGFTYHSSLIPSRTARTEKLKVREQFVYFVIRKNQ